MIKTSSIHQLDEFENGFGRGLGGGGSFFSGLMDMKFLFLTLRHH